MSWSPDSYSWDPHALVAAPALPPSGGACSLSAAAEPASTYRGGGLEPSSYKAGMEKKKPGRKARTSILCQVGAGVSMPGWVGGAGATGGLGGWLGSMCPAGFAGAGAET